jgi:hypothetical protein
VTVYIDGVEVETAKLPFITGATADSHAFVGVPPMDVSGSATPGVSLITKPPSQLNDADAPPTAAMRLQAALAPLSTTPALCFSLASLQLLDSAVAPATIAALFAVGPVYGGQCHGGSGDGRSTPLRHMLASTLLDRMQRDDMPTLPELQLDATVTLPPASGVILTLSAHLASRVLTNPPPESEHGDSSEWSSNLDHARRLYVHDRAPSTAGDAMSGIQCVSAGGIITGFIEGCVAVGAVCVCVCVYVCVHGCACACVHVWRARAGRQ